MNKEEFITILQSCIFAFEGKNEEEIKGLNLDYNYHLIQIGVQLCDYLKKQEVKNG